MMFSDNMKFSTAVCTCVQNVLRSNGSQVTKHRNDRNEGIQARHIAI